MACLKTVCAFELKSNVLTQKAWVTPSFFCSLKSE
jgi:hypothetical protein